MKITKEKVEEQNEVALRIKQQVRYDAQEELIKKEIGNCL